MDILDKFTIDPIFDDIIDPHKYFENYDLDNKKLNEYITEASKNVSKKSIIKSLLNLIKKLFKMIINGIKKIIEFITSIFKKTSKTVFDIIDEIGLKVKQIIKLGSNRYERIKVPANKLSTIKLGDDVTVPINPMKIKFENNDKVIIKILPYLYNNVIVAGHHTQFGHFLLNMQLALDLINGKDKTLDEIADFIEALEIIKDKAQTNEEIKSKKLGEKIQKIQNKFTALDKEYYGNNLKNSQTLKTGLFYKFNLSDLRNMNTKLQEVYTKLIRESDDAFTNLNDYFNKNNSQYNDVIKNISYIFNELCNYLRGIQFGLNIITGSLKEIYDIPAEYIGAISDMETLSKFAEKLIQYGFPSKYVMLNLYLIADESLRGTKGNENAPIWGQSRVVFLPDNNEDIHKIAINALGLESNAAEYRVYKQFKEAKADDILAQVSWISGNKYALNMRKAKTMGIFKYLLYKTKIDAMIKEASKKVQEHFKGNVHISLIDIHPGNIGKIDDKLVLIDYGF